ncbi:uncharacterized protein MICPUCDRAFT_55818 [Micromonas pusilla CCMP1545]|uniref:Predicted protein n=1 Tax=Micromonas pusilla (strain CCMP1545) TaxID=564608 RepID=C1MJG4_MICPC|nr:uncharacterized protein MICPUCDRAFT_55818 [Micromonas pusilla CCMP1545]EEH59586.1 predicted protein [Micromonas pusilla CCMP1545]|eukprot:XP_003056210.1 predicted protein [Micromonas pusilla CCMP1545]
MLTEYERKREARIARNRAILLALVGDLPNALTTTPSPPPRARVKAKEKRARIAIDLEDLRRSDRVRRLPARVYTTFERDEDLGDDAARRRAASDLPKPKPKPKPTRVAAVATASAKAKSPAAPPAKGGIKTLVVRARAFAANHLGASIGDGTGAKKAAVIHALAAPRRDARFSKYSGIQEFKNVVCLFVNVGDKNGNAYDNVFTHAGGRITWFAQPRQTEATPVIERILNAAGPSVDGSTARLARETAPAALSPRASIADAAPADDDAEGRVDPTTTTTRDADADGDEDAKEPPAWPLHLFARMEGCEYVYCGRLRALEHDPRKVPMKFTFRLLDAPLLRRSDDFLVLHPKPP